MLRTNFTTWLIAVFLFATSSLLAQKTSLTLDYCQQKARENYPLLKQKDLLRQSSDLTVENIGKAYLPGVNVNAQATYQSTTIDIPFEIPGQEIPVFPKDHYQFTLDLSQTIYDGGTVHSQKEIQQTTLDADQQKVEVELYNLRKQVNAIYFSVLLGDQTIEQLNLSRDDLQKKYDQLTAAVHEGAALKSSADQVQADMMQIDQHITEAQSLRIAYIKSLALLINDSIDDKNVKLEMPQMNSIPAYNISLRPDFILLQKQQNNFEAMKQLTKTSTIPHLGAFAQLGYAQPGPDPFTTTLEPFYIVGLKLNWNLWNWNSSKNQRQIYSIQQDVLHEQINTLDVNTKLQVLQQQEDMDKLRKLIDQDAQLIDLRKSISQSASAQVDNGVITVTDYLTQVNQQYQAELALRTHQLQLIYAYVNYLTTLGQ